MARITLAVALCTLCAPLAIAQDASWACSLEANAMQHRVKPCARKVLADSWKMVNDAGPSGVPGIDRIFVVHYSKLVDRKAKLSKALAAQGLTATWLSEFDRSAISPDVRDCLFGAQKADTGAAAGTWSHYTVFNAMVEHGWSHVLILEDDVVLPVDVTQQLQSHIPCAAAAPSPAAGVGFDILQLAENAAGMVISQHGARKMLSLLTEHQEKKGKGFVTQATDSIIRAASPTMGECFGTMQKMFCVVQPDLGNACADWTQYGMSQLQDWAGRGCQPIRLWSVTPAKKLWGDSGTGSWQVNGEVHAKQPQHPRKAMSFAQMGRVTLRGKGRAQPLSFSACAAKQYEGAKQQCGGTLLASTFV